MSEYANHPFSDYKLYRVWHKTEGRWYAQLVIPGITGSKAKRITISYARYKMSVKLKRRLLPSEEVDHKDADKSNDSIGNLQLLTPKKNRQKMMIETGRSMMMVSLSCPVCATVFTRQPRQVNHKISQGKSPACSRRCGGIMSSW
jgi:hypothetical protein